jgi:hypothetical protein
MTARWSSTQERTTMARHIADHAPAAKTPRHGDSRKLTEFGKAMITGDNSFLTRLRAMYGIRNLEWRSASFLTVSRPGRQAMVD